MKTEKEALAAIRQADDAERLSALKPSAYKENLFPHLRRFWLYRDEDPTGVGGTGIVAEGIIFSDGRAVLRWLSAVSAIGVYPNLDSIRLIHGHQGRTKILMNDVYSDVVPPESVEEQGAQPWKEP